MIFPTIVLPIILKNEGVRFSPTDSSKIIDTGYVNDPDDSGGETNFGITQNTYDHTKVKKVKDITLGEVAHIYERDYWLACKCDKISEVSLKLAINVCDCAVNCGTGIAIVMLQEVLGVKSDGVIGSVTLSNLSNVISIENVNTEYSLKRTMYYAHLAQILPKNLKFLVGWILRVGNTMRLSTRVTTLSLV